MILVTGATGGFGRPLSRWLRENGREPLTLTASRSLENENYVSCDMRDQAAIRALIQRLQPTTIFHLAGTLTSEFEPNLAINALSAKHILDALEEVGTRARVVLIGSAAEYGIVEPSENPVREERALRPVSVYGLTKAFQTQIATFYAYRGADVVVARAFNFSGPGLSERLFIGRVEKMIAQFKRGEIGEIRVGNLGAQRDYVEVDEAIRQVTMIAANGESGGVYHVGSGQPVSMRDLLCRLLKAAGMDPSIVKEDDPAHGRTDYDVPIIYADMTKTRALFDVE